MSLIERLEKQAKWHERRIWRTNSHWYAGLEYWQEDEDARALLTEAVERIKGLSLLVDRKQGRTHYDPIERRRVHSPLDCR